MSKWLCALTLAGFCAACGGPEFGPAGDRGHHGERARRLQRPRKRKRSRTCPTYREVTIPSGTTLRLDLQSAVSSDASQVEDTVRASLRQAVSIDGQPVLPPGTELVGTVTDVARSGRVKGRARVAYRFRFTSIRQRTLSHRHRTDLSPGARRPRRRTRRRSAWVLASARPSVRFSVAAAALRRVRRSAVRPARVRCWRRAEMKFVSGPVPTSTRG